MGTVRLRLPVMSEPRLTGTDRRDVGGSGGVPEDALDAAFQAGASLFTLLSSVRSRRLGAGYQVDAGPQAHPVTGRTLPTGTGPQHFVSRRAPQPLSVDETALLAWATCGPNGIIAWEAAASGSFHQLSSTRGRTAPEPNNTLATDLLVIDDDGAHLYRPRPSAAGQWPHGADRVGPEQVRQFWDTGRTTVSDRRPDLDASLRLPGAPRTPVLGTHQDNFNRPGSVWLLPVTDAGRLLSGMLDLFAGRRCFLVDDFSDGALAGLDRFVRDGLLDHPVPLSSYEQGVLRTSLYPAGCMVQNTRLAAEAMGLGAWCFSGYDPYVVLGGHPEVTRGLGFTVGAANPRAPLPGGRRHTHGLAGLLASTSVPSPQYPDPRTLVQAWHDERYGPGAWGDPDNGLLVGPESPWPAERGRRLASFPGTRLPAWVWDAAEAYITYCIERFGQFPVTYDPTVAGFGTVVHHLDTDYYDTHLQPGYLTDSHHEHDGRWHSLPRHQQVGGPHDGGHSFVPTAGAHLTY